MSNNIYDILKKIESLEAPKKTNLTESKMTTVKELHNESKKEKQTHKGTIAEAVAQVEQQLNEKYMGFKKLEKSIAARGDVKDPGAVAASIGRKKYGKEKFQKAAAAGKKLGEAVGQEGPADLLAAVEQEINNPGRSIDNLTDVLNATFGSDRSPEFKKARAVIGKYIDLVDNAAMGSEEDGIAPMRGGNIARHIQQYDLTDYLKHAAAMLDKAVKGPMDESGLQAYLGKKKYGEKGMAALQKAGREGASKEKMAQIRAKHDKMDEGSYNEDMLSAKQKEFAALAEPKDKITYADKIAGAKKGKKTEGNKFSGNLMKARAQGLKQADLDGDGDMEKVTPGKSNMREGWEEMQKYLEKKRGPESKGGEGKKAGTRYGGSAQKDDDDEEMDGEGKPVEKKKGRPKGTSGGAKFSFKKPKD